MFDWSDAASGKDEDVAGGGTDDDDDDSRQTNQDDAASPAGSTRKSKIEKSRPRSALCENALSRAGVLPRDAEMAVAMSSPTAP